MARPASSTPTVPASPATADPASRTAQPVVKIRRAPNRSDSRPPRLDRCGDPDWEGGGRDRGLLVAERTLGGYSIPIDRLKYSLGVCDREVDAPGSREK